MGGAHAATFGPLSGLAALSMAAGLLVAVASTSAAAPPDNDMFGSARVIDGWTGVARGSSRETTIEAGEPSHAGERGGRSVWFAWTAPRSGPVAFETLDFKSWVAFDTLLAVYTGRRVDGLTRVASNDDFDSSTAQSRVSFRAVRGTTYRVVIDDYRHHGGDYRLHWGMRPANDDFAAAQRIRRMSGRAPFDDTASATRETDEPSHGAHSVWYRWTAPRSGAVRFHTRGSDFDTVLAVYEGAGLEELSLVVANDNIGLRWPSRVTFLARAGRTYRISVASSWSTHSGEVVLGWRPVPGGIQQQGSQAPLTVMLPIALLLALAWAALRTRWLPWLTPWLRGPGDPEAAARPDEVVHSRRPRQPGTAYLPFSGSAHATRAMGWRR